MSVRVNLLPREVAQRNAAARAQVALVAAGVLLLVLLTAVYFWQVGRVNNAQAELTAAEVERDRLQTEVAALAEFDDLQTRALAATTMLQTVLGEEVSFAGVLQDVAAVMPSDAELTSLSISLGAGASDVYTGRISAGQLTASGSVRRGHAPGVERLIIQFEKVASFFDVWVGSSSVDLDSDVATFSFDLKLGPEIFTRRYVNGLPEELR